MHTFRVRGECGQKHVANSAERRNPSDGVAARVCVLVHVFLYFPKGWSLLCSLSLSEKNAQKHRGRFVSSPWPVLTACLPAGESGGVCGGQHKPAGPLPLWTSVSSREQAGAKPRGTSTGRGGRRERCRHSQLQCALLRERSRGRSGVATEPEPEGAQGPRRTGGGPWR